MQKQTVWKRDSPRDKNLMDLVGGVDRHHNHGTASVKGLKDSSLPGEYTNVALNNNQDTS